MAALALSSSPRPAMAPAFDSDGVALAVVQRADSLFEALDQYPAALDALGVRPAVERRVAAATAAATPGPPPESCPSSLRRRLEQLEVRCQQMASDVEVSVLWRCCPWSSTGLSL